MMDFLTALVMGSALNQMVDTDKDGLPDEWEVNGFGPIDPKEHRCDPKRADVFLIFKPRSGVLRADLDSTIRRVVKFYADLDFTNPDGSKGLHAIPIVLDALEADDDGKDYKSLYETAMPKEWRGIGHGVLVEVSKGGGGQTNRPDWCGSSNRWHTIVHELGHQFGLDHGPKGGQTGSPYHTSLMNYDYSYTFNGSGEKVHYSKGLFKDLRMKETDLSEKLPYLPSDLEFLSKAPYFFKVKPDGDEGSFVDWNRNGIFGEEHVKADVNDGYSVDLRGNMTLGLAAGAPSLIDAGEYLGIVTPVLADESDYKEQVWKLSKERSGWLQIAFYNGRIKVSDLVVNEKIAPVTGECSAAFADGKLFVSTPIDGGFQFIELAVKEGHPELKEVRQTKTDEGDVTLVGTPDGVRILRWNKNSGSVSMSNWERTWEKTLAGVTSQVAVGATWNSKRSCLALVEVVDYDRKKNRLRIAHVYGDAKVGFEVTDRKWVEGVSGNIATNERPVILFDASSDRGPSGAYNVYAKRMSKENERQIALVARQIADPAMSEGWRVKMVGNEWAHGMNMPGACFYQGDIAYAYRLGFGESIQKISLSMNASGIEDRWLADFDEVEYLFTTGLMQSLQRVQREVGLIER